MPVISTSLKDIPYRKARYIIKKEFRWPAGFLRHLVYEKIRAYEAEHGEIILPEEEKDGP